MWLLRRLRLIKLDTELILEYYLKEIRPLVEFGIAISNSGLTKGQVNDLEKVQKVALKIILHEDYTSYEVVCTLVNISPLEYRQTELCTNYAVKLYRSPKSSEYFIPAKKLVNTRSEQQLLVKEQKCNYNRAYNASHNYLARLVNANKEQNLKTL